MATLTTTETIMESSPSNYLYRLSSSPPQPITATLASSPQNVKLKFFHSIGLEPPQTSKDTASTSKNSTSIAMDNSSWSQRIQNVSTFKERLKYNRHEDKRYGKSATNKDNDWKMKNRKSLSFDETVEVVPIPMRNEYSNRVKARLWSNAAEIQENAARNSLEFAHEGWNWRNVVEDEHMYVCVATAELIHPCHYEPLAAQHGFR